MRGDIIQARGYNPSIAGDELSLKIASYPTVARYVAERVGRPGGTACELCCGVGVSLLELSTTFGSAIGIDNDPAIVEHCRQNLGQAGVTNCELRCADVRDPQTLTGIQADVVLYDIPYWSTHDGVVDPERQNPDLQQIVANIAKCITPNIVVYAPTHLSYQSACNALGDCEFVEVYVGDKHDRNLIFLGDLIQQYGVTQVKL